MTESSQEAKNQRSARKRRIGIVVSDKMDKTAVVAVSDAVRHPLYKKIVRRTRKYYAHDETNEAKAGDRVAIIETRPVSKSKRWRIGEIIERAR